MRPARVSYIAVTHLVAVGVALTTLPCAAADDVDADPSAAGSPVQVAEGPTPDNGGDPAAVGACAQFAEVLDGSSQYYGDFADSLEGSNYTDAAVSSSNTVGRTALRESAGLAMNAANTPGLQPDIADPMRTWSLGAAALLVKMGLHIPGESLNSTANNMNIEAEKVQQACAAAGTHA